jgi:hypothetical protein
LEDKVAIKQLLAQGVELVCHVLHLVAVVTDAKSGLLESTEPFVKLKDVSLTVVEELNLDSKTRMAAHLRGFTDDLLQLNGEGVKHPRQHNPTVMVPVRNLINLVSEDMIVEGVAT